MSAPLRILAACLLLSALAAESEIDAILSERDAAVAVGERDYAAEVAKAQEALDAITAKADQRAIGDLERLAKRAARGGDMATGAGAWKAVLGLDREHQEARAYFEAVGNLDQVLAELDQAEADAAAADLLGAPAQAATATGPLSLAAVGVFGSAQIHPLKPGIDAIGGLGTPITTVPDQLGNASFVQPPVIASEWIRCRVWRPGVVAVVAGPGYGGMDAITAAGFERADFALGVAGGDQAVWVAELAAGTELELPPGHVMVIAGHLRPLPAALQQQAGGRMRR